MSGNPLDEVDFFVGGSSRIKLMKHLAKKNSWERKHLPQTMHLYAMRGEVHHYRMIVELCRSKLRHRGSLPASLVNIRNSRGHTPLYVAVTAGCHDAAKQIIGWGADEWTVPYGESLMKAACERGDYKMMMMLYRQLKRAAFAKFNAFRQLKRMLEQEVEDAELMALVTLMMGRYSPYESVQSKEDTWLCDSAIGFRRWRLLDTFLELGFGPSSKGLAALTKAVISGVKLGMHDLMAQNCFSVFRLIGGLGLPASAYARCQKLSQSDHLPWSAYMPAPVVKTEVKPKPKAKAPPKISTPAVLCSMVGIVGSPYMSEGERTPSDVGA